MRKKLILGVIMLFPGVANILPGENGADNYLDQIHTISGIRFPLSSKILFFSHQVGMDDEWKIKIRIPAAEFRKILNEPPLKNVKWSNNGIFPQANEPSWNSNELIYPLFCQVRLKRGRVANFIYSFINGEHAIIYIQIFET